MKKILAFILAAFFVFLSPVSAFAATTESMIMYNTSPSMMMLSIQQDDYSVMPTAIYDEEDVSIEYRFSIMDRNLGTYLSSSQPTKKTYPANVRFSGFDNNAYIGYSNNTNPTDFTNANTVQIVMSISDASGAGNPILAARALGYQLQLYAPSFEFRYYNDNTILSQYRLTNSKPVKAFVRNYDENGLLLNTINLNLNDIDILAANTNIQNRITSNVINISSPAVTGSTEMIYTIDVYLQYELPPVPDNVTRTFLRAEFPQTNSYISGVYNLSNTQGGTSQDDYNKNVEAELGNIQTGINNVINSVVQMGNQAWQGAQQTVQAVTQMTQQLNTAIDQQRQDILNGLGLLGDDIGSSLTNVKTEIKNIGSSITNKLESTTQSITNKIESTTDTITNTIENKVDQVTTAVNNVKQSVTEVKQSILDLPNKIKDMLLGLIVPDSQTMADKYSEFSQLLEQKLGVIYQIPMMLFDFFDTIVNAATTPQSTLTLPAFRLPWIDGSQLTIWNSMEYKIIPDGLEVLSDLIRTVTSMTVVVLTFNSVKQAYERFLRS